MKRSLLLLLTIAAFPLGALSQTVDSAWEAIVTADQTLKPPAPGVDMKTARREALSHLSQQEQALRQFITSYPRDPRVIDARLRLAHVLASRAEMEGQPILLQHAAEILNVTARLAPAERQVDVAFALLSLEMRQINAPTEAIRRSLTQKVNQFRRQFPTDRRIPGLLAEIATLYDHDPQQKEALLSAALPLASDPSLNARITDDLRRLARLNRPLEFKATAMNGEGIDLAAYRGRVVVLYFFAAWSVPSVVGLQELALLEDKFPGQPLTIIGISLDQKREELINILSPLNRSWLIVHETAGWESPLVRELSINALPTLWIIDRQGVLRAISGQQRTEALLRSYLAAP